MLAATLISILIGASAHAENPIKLCGQKFSISKPRALKVEINCPQKDQVVRVIREQDGSVFERHLFEVKNGEPIRVSIENSEGRLVRSFDSKSLTLPAAVPRELPLKIALIDSGLDLNHSDLRNHLDISEEEQPNGIDDDGNGFIDDQVGLNWSYSEQNPFNLPLFHLAITQFPSDLVSHGTHVASLIVAGHADVALTAYSFPENWSDVTRVRSYFAEVSRHLKIKKISVVNMSIGTEMAFGGPPPAMAQYHAIYQDMKKTAVELISGTPETLFVVAAGNGVFGGGTDLGKIPYPSLPAAVVEPNILTVGSVNNTLDKISVFSNYSPTLVDILAPGEEVSGALLGGGSIVLSGTSMATPRVINQGLVPLLRELPDLTPMQMKEIILKTADVDWAHPFPVKSGGIVSSERVQKVARLLKAQGLKDIEKEILQVRRAEGASEEWLEGLVQFWRQRQF